MNLCIKDRDLGSSDCSWYLISRLDIAVAFLSGFQTSNVSKNMESLLPLASFLLAQVISSKKTMLSVGQRRISL